MIPCAKYPSPQEEDFRGYPVSTGHCYPAKQSAPFQNHAMVWNWHMSEENLILFELFLLLIAFFDRHVYIFFSTSSFFLAKSSCRKNLIDFWQSICGLSVLSVGYSFSGSIFIYFYIFLMACQRINATITVQSRKKKHTKK